MTPPRNDPRVDALTAVVGDHHQELVQLEGRLDAHANALRKDQAETAAEQGLPRDLVTVEQNALLRHFPRRDLPGVVAALEAAA